jgi:L-histidine N-alpha-methyltransferase
MLDEQANEFLKALSEVMNKGDKLLLGLDLKKKEEIVLPAYNDAQGFTAAFNLNLLDRINRELGADFNREAFAHKPQYIEQTGLAKSYLMSTKVQDVRIGHIGETVHFEEGETIFMEISRKYDDDAIREISANTSLNLITQLFDSKKWFSDFIFEKQ